MLTDGLVWIIVTFYQMFGLPFWRHPFTAEYPLVSKWCNATFLQILWRKLSDMWPSMVTYTRNSCSAFNPKCTHMQWTHTVNTHLEQWEAIYAAASGSSWGFGALLKGTSVVVLTVERALYIHIPPPTIPARWRLELEKQTHLHLEWPEGEPFLLIMGIML